MDALAAFLHYDAPGAGRCLSRVGTTALAGRLLPAARALAEAIDIVLAEEWRAAAGCWPDSPVLATGPPAARPPRAGPSGAGQLSAAQVAARQIAAGLAVRLDFTVSPTCLLGICRTAPGACSSPLCEHHCHQAGRVTIRP